MEEADALVFNHALVNQHYVAVYVDFSDDEDPRTRKAQAKFAIKGTPTILAFAPRFQRELLRLNEYVPPAELLTRLSRA